MWVKFHSWFHNHALKPGKASLLEVRLQRQTRQDVGRPSEWPWPVNGSVKDYDFGGKAVPWLQVSMYMVGGTLLVYRV